MLKNKVQHQACLIEALWTLLKEKYEWSDEDLAEHVKRIRENYRPENRKAPDCPSCGRALQVNSSICIYCGADITDKKSVFHS